MAIIKISNSEGSNVLLKNAKIEYSFYNVYFGNKTANSDISKDNSGTQKIVIICEGMTYRTPLSFIKRNIFNICWWLIDKLENRKEVANV